MVAGFEDLEYWQEKCASLMDDISERNNKIKVRDDIIEDLHGRLKKQADDITDLEMKLLISRQAFLDVKETLAKLYEELSEAVK